MLLNLLLNEASHIFMHHEQERTRHYWHVAAVRKSKERRKYKASRAVFWPDCQQACTSIQAAGVVVNMINTAQL